MRGKKRRLEGHSRSPGGAFDNAVSFAEHVFSIHVEIFNDVNFLNEINCLTR